MLKGKTRYQIALAPVLGKNQKTKTIKIEAYPASQHRQQCTLLLGRENQQLPNQKIADVAVRPKQQKCIATRPNMHPGGNPRPSALLGSLLAAEKKEKIK